MKNIHIINGPNLNMLGIREKELYGTKSLEEINAGITAESYALGINAVFFQSSHEGEIIEYIHGLRRISDGIIINAGAYSHYSIAIADAVSAVGVPAVEVHITNVYRREEARRRSVLAPVCVGQISGLGETGYILALRYFALK